MTFWRKIRGMPRYTCSDVGFYFIFTSHPSDMCQLQSNKKYEKPNNDSKPKQNAVIATTVIDFCYLSKLLRPKGGSERKEKTKKKREESRRRRKR